MIRDYELMFVRPEVANKIDITTATTTTLTNSVDLGKARPTGSGKQLIPYVKVTGAAAAGTNPTVAIQLVGSDDTAGSTNPVVLSQSRPFPISNSTIHTFYGPSMAPSDVKKRHITMKLVSAGTSPDFDVNEAGLVADIPTNNPTYLP